MSDSIGQRIKERRKAKGWSAQRLGQEIGRDRQSVYLYESGTEITDVRVLRKLVELELMTIGEAFGEAHQRAHDVAMIALKRAMGGAA